MATVTAGTLPVLFLPLLLSLAGLPGTPMVRCLVRSVMAMLLSVEAYGAVLPWVTGMAISLLSIREKIHRRRAASTVRRQNSPIAK